MFFIFQEGETEESLQGQPNVDSWKVFDDLLLEALVKLCLWALANHMRIRQLDGLCDPEAS